MRSYHIHFVVQRTQIIKYNRWQRRPIESPSQSSPNATSSSSFLSFHSHKLMRNIFKHITELACSHLSSKFSSINVSWLYGRADGTMTPHVVKVPHTVGDCIAKHNPIHRDQSSTKSKSRLTFSQPTSFHFYETTNCTLKP